MNSHGKIFRTIWSVIAFLFLTVVTQIGGIILLVSLAANIYFNKTIHNHMLRRLSKMCLFLILYSLATFFVVPLLAKPFGRVPLPLSENENVKPLNFLTCFLNRHYVTPQLNQTTKEVAKEMQIKFPGTVLNYLDANFPFIRGFPLIPHLSHNDGKKLDLAFLYIENKTEKPSDEAPSFIGYGINEAPRRHEINTANICKKNGNWQYSFLMKIIPQGNKQNFTFDSSRTKAMVSLFAGATVIDKIFIEPHLKTRMKLQSQKIRFHGCQAVRHDDHLHIQVR